MLAVQVSTETNFQMKQNGTFQPIDVGTQAKDKYRFPLSLGLVPWTIEAVCPDIDNTVLSLSDPMTFIFPFSNKTFLMYKQLYNIKCSFPAIPSPVGQRLCPGRWGLSQAPHQLPEMPGRLC